MYLTNCAFQNHLFHPFSQENPLQTGTGLGLAIVNSIVRSQSVDGKVDVWSAEGVGTEIKITFTAEKVEDQDVSERDTELTKLYDTVHPPSVSLIGFDTSHKGVEVLRTVLSSYLVNWWGLTLADDTESGDVAIINEDPTFVAQEKDRRRPLVVLSSLRGDPKLMTVVNEYERIGGFCRIVFKPVGPHRLYSVLKLCLHALRIAQARETELSQSQLRADKSLESALDFGNGLTSGLSRRYSEEKTQNGVFSHLRPPLGPRAATAHPLSSWSDLLDTSPQDEPGDGSALESPSTQSPSSPTVPVGSGGSILKTSIGTLERKNRIRVLVVEDNAILRSLL